MPAKCSSLSSLPVLESRRWRWRRKWGRWRWRRCLSLLILDEVEPLESVDSSEISSSLEILCPISTNEEIEEVLYTIFMIKTKIEQSSLTFLERVECGAECSGGLGGGHCHLSIYLLVEKAALPNVPKVESLLFM